ncbi:Fic family protein [Treponema primitia]|uniref:Fic family protein n=1 Tax=Treponema primitia TaxID=88058 RepID=UPI00397FA654
MLSQIAELDEFKGAWIRLSQLRPEQLSTLRKISTVESVGSSNRIEGNKLSDADVEKLLSRIRKTSFGSRDEEEVAGYAELMDTVFENYELIPLSENYIKQLHKIMLKHVGKDINHRGEYKKLPNSVAAFDSKGNEIGIVFETASLFDTPRLMEALVDWTRKNLEDTYLHPLLVIGVFIVHFLAIHPFQDGNGRLSRALTVLLLLKKGYGYIPYSSMESIIELNKEGYYRSLRLTQKNIWSGKTNYEPWLSFFLSTLQKQKRHLEEKIRLMKPDTAVPIDLRLSRTAVSILDLFKKRPQWTSAEIAEALNLNIETSKKTVKSLVNAGYLVKHGITRGAWYEGN